MDPVQVHYKRCKSFPKQYIGGFFKANNKKLTKLCFNFKKLSQIKQIFIHSSVYILKYSPYKRNLLVGLKKTKI